MVLSKAYNLDVVGLPREIPSKFIGITLFKHCPRITYMPLICLCHYCNILFWYDFKFTEKSYEYYKEFQMSLDRFMNCLHFYHFLIIVSLYMYFCIFYSFSDTNIMHLHWKNKIICIII